MTTQEWIKTQHGTAGWEQKLISFVEGKVRETADAMVEAVEESASVNGGGEFYDGAGNFYRRAFDDGTDSALHAIKAKRDELTKGV